MHLENRLYFMVMTRGLGCFRRCLRDQMERHRFLLPIILRFAASLPVSPSIGFCAVYLRYTDTFDHLLTLC